MTKLKPCPFCGGEAKLLNHTNRGSEYGETAFACCMNCGASGEMFFKSFKYSANDKAIEAWNRREGEQQ